MAFFIGLLTFVLVLDCAALILLVLMQLPKKDAGAGLAFGGGATDALFGAGSGNVLTKATKYAATIFFVLALVIGILQSNFHQRSVTALIEATTGAPVATPAPAAAPSTPMGTPFALPGATNFAPDPAPPAQPPQDTATNPLPAE